jgi:hypothetical protein
MLKLGIRSISYTLPGTFSVPEAPKGAKSFIEPAQLYKPAQQIVFDDKGETLVFSAENLSKFQVFFPVPWSLGTWSVPLAIWQMSEGNLAANIWSFAALYAAVLPHCHYLYNLRFTIDKVWYIRGGHWKLQTSGVQGVVTTVYTSPDNLEISGNAELCDQGNLQGSIELTASSWTEFYERISDQKLKLPAYGQVVNPELFAAMLQKAKIDDSNFVIDHSRYLA